MKHERSISFESTFSTSLNPKCSYKGTLLGLCVCSTKGASLNIPDRLVDPELFELLDEVLSNAQSEQRSLVAVFGLKDVAAFMRNGKQIALAVGN